MDFEKIIKTIPYWKKAKKINIEPINAGYSNRNYMINVDNEKFVLRINGKQNTFLGLEYKDEAQIIELAAKHDLAPKILPCDSDEYLITYFLDGSTLKIEQMHNADIINKITSLLKKVHMMPFTGKRFSTPFSLTRGNLAGAKKLGINYSPDLIDFLNKMAIIEKKRQSDPSYLKYFCHNDMFTHNIIHCWDDNYRLIDWEFSGFGDIWFDLATISFSCGFDRIADEALLCSYFGEIDKEKIINLNDMKLVCMVREISWALMHTAINRTSPDPGKDYMDFANSVLDRLKQGLVTLI